MSAVAKTQTQQNKFNFSELVTQGPARNEFTYSIDTNNLPVDTVPTLSTPELDPKKRDQSQLDSLTQGVQDLSGYHYRQAAALASSLSDTIVTSTLAPMTQALAGLKGGIEKIGDIFKDADTFSVTQELAQRAQGLIAEVKEHLATFAAEAGKFKGLPAQRAAEDAHSLSEILSELAKSPTIDPAQQKGKQPEFPLGSIDVTPPNLGGFGPIDAIADTFRSEQDFSRAWADALTAKRQEQFAKLVAGSKDTPLDIERPRRDLQGESIVSHLEKTNSELIASISDAKVALATKDREHTSAHERAETIAAKVQNLFDAHGVVSSQIQDQEAAIKHLQDISAPDTGNAPAAQAQSDKKPGVLARVKSVAARFMRGRQTAEEANDQRDTVSPSSQNSEELKNLQHTLTELTAKKVDIGDQFGIEKNNLLSAIALRDSIEGVITQLQTKLSAAKDALQDALRQTCKDLHFTLPNDTANPVTEALLKISIPTTKDPIPSINSVLDKEYLQDLGAQVVDVDGGLSLRHPATGKTITIERRSSHGFDATLTVTDANGEQVASNRIWNDDLKKLVDHFLRTGNAPVREKQVQSWKVVDEATAPEADRSKSEAHAYLGVSTRAAKLVGFLKDALTAEGHDIKAPKSSEEPRIVSNRLDIAHSVNEVAKSVTALLDKNTFKWSLLIEGTRQVALTTLDALAKVVDYCSTSSREAPATTPEESQGSSASFGNTANERSPELEQRRKAIRDAFRYISRDFPEGSNYPKKGELNYRQVRCIEVANEVTGISRPISESTYNELKRSHGIFGLLATDSNWEKTLQSSIGPKIPKLVNATTFETTPSDSVVTAIQTEVEQLSKTLAGKFVGTKLSLSEPSIKTSATITGISVTPPPRDGSITGHLVELTVKPEGSETPETWSFRAEADALARLLAEESPTIRSHVGKFRFSGRNAASSTAEPKQDAPETAEQSKAARRDKLAGEIYSAWNNAAAAPTWEYALPNNAVIQVKIDTDPRVISLTIDGKRIGQRTDNDLERALRIIVGRYMQEPGVSAISEHTSKWDLEEAQNRQPTTSYAEFQRSAEAAHENLSAAEQARDPNQEQGPVHKH